MIVRQICVICSNAVLCALSVASDQTMNSSTAKCAVIPFIVLKKPYWLGLEFDGAVLPLRDLQIDLPVAPSKVIAVGLNYAEHIAEMKRTPLGTPLIWFKAPTSLLPHEGTIEIAFPEHQTHFEARTRRRHRHAREERQRGPCARARLRIHDRRRYQRPRFADFRETIWASQILRHLHAGRTVCLHWMWTSRICRSRSGKTAKSGSKRARAR